MSFEQCRFIVLLLGCVGSGIVLTDNAKAQASSLSMDGCQLMRMDTTQTTCHQMDFPASRERVERSCGSCSIDIRDCRKNASPENRIVDYQIGQNVWRRTGWTNNEVLERIDCIPGLKTGGRLKEDARLSSGTLATD